MYLLVFGLQRYSKWNKKSILQQLILFMSEIKMVMFFYLEFWMTSYKNAF